MSYTIELAGEHFLLEGVRAKELKKYEAFGSVARGETYHVQFLERPLSFSVSQEEYRLLPDGALFAFRDFCLSVNKKKKMALAEGRYTPYAVENMLRMLLAYVLYETKRGFLLHSAGVVFKDRAYLFFGKSGSGKSTWSSMQKGKVLLSDELVAVSESESTFMAHSTPFWGDFKHCPVKTQAKVGAAFHLNGQKKFTVRPLGLPDALFALLPCVVFYGHFADRYLFDKALKFARSIPCFDFSFEKNKTDFKTIIKENVVAI